MKPGDAACPAQHFLLQSLRVSMNLAEPSVLPGLLQQTDWWSVDVLAGDVQLRPTLYALLLHGKLPPVPPEMAERWKREVAVQALLHMVYETEGARVLSCLNEQGFAPVLLKGFARMADLYGSSACRGISDMDILIRPADFPAIKQALLAQGFVLAVDEFYAPQAAAYEKFQAEQSYEASFKKTFAGVSLVLDVHWHMGAGWPGYEHLGIFALDRVDWQEQTETFVFQQVTLRRLSLNAHFFHLMGHFALHHRFSGVKWLHELALLLDRYAQELDWAWIGDTARRTGCVKLVGATMRLVAEFLGPAHRLAGRWQEYWPVFLPGEVALYQKRLFRSGSQMADAACLLLLIDRSLDRVRLVGYLLFDPGGIPQLRLSASAYSLPRRMVQPFYLLWYVLAGPGKKK
jgi:hypothetical protein